jgi:tRNA (mo5U34)-methyltransferase
MSEQLAQEVSRYPWFHSIDLGGGVATPGGKAPHQHERESAAFFDRVKLFGRSVLDIGAWNGFYSFEAKRRGAERVLATDSYCWTHPIFQGRKTFELARRALCLEVEAREIDAGDISSDTVGEFDIVLFLGVFYHRYDALDALARAAGVAKHLLIVETLLDLPDVERPAMAFYPPGRKPCDDHTNWWGPNVLCMKELLLGHKFIEIESQPHPDGSTRGIFHAWRSTELRLAPLPAATAWGPMRNGFGARIINAVRRSFAGFPLVRS